MTAAREQRDAKAGTQPVQRKEEQGSEGTDAIRSGLRGTSFAEGEAMLSPAATPPPAAPVQRKAAPVQRDESIAEQVPDNVDLRAARVSFTLPAGRRLASGLLYDATTASATTVTISVAPEAMRISTSPSLPFDVQFPGANMSFYGAGVRFGSGEVFAEFFKSGTGFDCTATGREKVVALITRGISGTALARPGYNPLTDHDLLSTLMRVKANFDALPEARGAGAVPTADLSRPTIGATLAMRTPFFQESDGAGVRIAAGGQFDVSIAGSGDLARILAAGNPQAAAMAAGINSVGVRSEAIELIKDGEAVAKLKRLRIAPGGAVTLESFEMLGGLGAGAGFESLIRLIAGGVALAERGVPIEIGMEATARSGGADPEIVRGVSRAMIEQGLTSAVQGLLRENRHALPGIDLALVFGG